MKLKKLKSYQLKPRRDLIAFRWIKPFLKSGLVLPENYFDIESHVDRENSLRVGRFYIGKVIACGSEIEELKLNDLILVHEYSIKNYEGAWKDDEIYFLEKKDCKCIITKMPKKGYIDFRMPLSEQERNHLANA